MQKNNMCIFKINDLNVVEGNCPKAFTYQNPLKKHLNTYQLVTQLNHHKSIHSGVKPYSYEVCKKLFTLQSSLKAHIKAIHLRINPVNAIYLTNNLLVKHI